LSFNILIYMSIKRKIGGEIYIFGRNVFFFSSRRRHTRFSRDWSSDVCSSDLVRQKIDLRESPSPFRFKEDIPHLSKRVTYIETSRGCPFSCQFCLSSIEVGVRYFNREKIKEDIRYLMANGAKTIKFVDRTFNISRSYAM